MANTKRDRELATSANIPHDTEDTTRRGMSSEAAAADDAETMASTGDSDNSFQDVVAGTATGLGIDRGESIGTGGLAAGEDRHAGAFDRVGDDGVA